MAEDRMALVIGNSDYADAPLTNPVNDARDMRDALKKVGFSVIYRENADSLAMNDAVHEFTRRLGKYSTGLLYYSGHGAQADGQNYLIPVKASIKTKAELKARAYDAGIVVDSMQDVGNRVNIVILDACRENPFRGFRSGSRGLASMSGPEGSFIAFATSPNDTAEDGGGRNGTYTKHLLRYIAQPGLGIEEMFKRVRIEVREETHRDQIPWETSSLTGDFCFAGCSGDSRPPLAATQPATVKLQPATTSATASPPTQSVKGEPEMVTIKGGCFQMGSPANEAGRDKDEQQHNVCIKDFKLSKYEVTVKEFRDFVQATGYKTEVECKNGWNHCLRMDEKFLLIPNNASWRNPGFSQADSHPVVCVSWNDANTYIEWLTKVTGKAYRLPTEAEWEYAARVGKRTSRFWGDGLKYACRFANVADETAGKQFNWKVSFPCADGYAYTAPVGSFTANPYQLYDILGNV